MIHKTGHYTLQGRKTTVTAADNLYLDGLVFITDIKSSRTQTCCHSMVIHTAKYKHSVWKFWSCLWGIPADPQYGSQVNMGQGPIPTDSMDAATAVWREGEFSAMGMSHVLSIGQRKGRICFISYYRCSH